MLILWWTATNKLMCGKHCLRSPPLQPWSNTETEKEKHQKTKTSEFERDGDTYRETFQRISPAGIYSPCQLLSEQTGKQEEKREKKKKKKPVGCLRSDHSCQVELCVTEHLHPIYGKGQRSKKQSLGNLAVF